MLLEISFERAVESLHPEAFDIHGPDQVGGAVDDRALQGLCFGQFPFRLLALGDVAGNAHQAD